MTEFCDRIVSFTSGIERAEFEQNRLVYDATIRNLELLGEAARRIPDDIRALSPEIEWARIVALRNVLIHGYFTIDNDILWDIVHNMVGPLRAALAALEKKVP
jgi:uncharacterized protein with HEPN domain